MTLALPLLLLHREAWTLCRCRATTISRRRKAAYRLQALKTTPTESFEFYLVFTSAKYLPQRIRALAYYLKDQLSQQS